MKAIIGLGNPDAKYLNTRHNMGYMAVSELLRQKNITLNEKFNSFFAKEGDILYLMPKTYMNLSGRAVSDLMRFYKLSLKDILIIFDDVSIPLGKMRFRSEGSDGGHNGIKSIIECIGSRKFDRLKLGIGAQPEGMPLEHFVLANFTIREKESLNNVISLAVKAISDYIEGAKIQELQNKYN